MLESGRESTSAALSFSASPHAIPSRPSDDARQHARSRRAVARRDLRGLSPSGGAAGGSLGRRGAGQRVRPAHGLHPVRHRRRRRKARLAGDAGEGELALTGRGSGFRVIERREITKLAEHAPQRGICKVHLPCGICSAQLYRRQEYFHHMQSVSCLRSQGEALKQIQ